jgi:hypothetical protein
VLIAPSLQETSPETAMSNACSTRREKRSIGAAGSWRGIDDLSVYLRRGTCTTLLMSQNNASKAAKISLK